MYRRHQHRARTTFAVVIGTCWAIGLIGLNGGRAASLQLFALGGLVLFGLWVVGALRRAVADAREPVRPTAVAPRYVSRNCVVIRPLGSDDHPSGRS